MSLKEFGRPFILYLILFGFAFSGYALAKQNDIRIGFPNFFWSLSCMLFLALVLAAYYRSKNYILLCAFAAHCLYFSLKFGVYAIPSTTTLYVGACGAILWIWWLKRKSAPQKFSFTFITCWSLVLIAWWLLTYQL